MSLFIDDAYDAELLEEVKIPTRLEKALTQTKELIKTAELKEREADRTAAKAAHELQKLGLSSRDIAYLLRVPSKKLKELVGKS